MGRALGESDPWGDGSVSGLIGPAKMSHIIVRYASENCEKIHFSGRLCDNMVAGGDSAWYGLVRAHLPRLTQHWVIREM